MTEEHEDDYLVIVRAQVMTRDESTEGWLPLAGGGLANVSIRKRARLPPDVGGHEYIIYGQRISDQTVILSCVINGDLQYFKVMPTFHHWRAGKQRNGLTFQTAADARAFDKGIIRAYAELIDVGEDDVFMTLDLPLDSSESRSSSEASGSQKSNTDKQAQSSKSLPPPPPSHIHIISSDKPPPPPPPQQQQPQSQQSSTIMCTTTTSTTSTTHPATAGTAATTEQPTSIAPGDNYSYVQLTAVHDYNYPVVDEPVSSMINVARRDSACSLKKRSALDNMPSSVQSLKEPSQLKNRLRCRYCQEFYTEEWNRKGACEFAPDCFKNGLERLSGMMCARCMLYHCMSDAEGETPQNPCECVFENGCTRRWIGLALLSLLVPCLWCYPPLRACHWIGVSCGICGGKHKPQI